MAETEPCRLCGGTVTITSGETGTLLAPPPGCTHAAGCGFEAVVVKLRDASMEWLRRRLGGETLH